MSVFAAYAHYYDLLYRDKDYAGEVDYVSRLLDRHAPGATRLLELGCGTGMHASLLAQRGRAVHGVDQSADMLEAAAKRVSSLPAEVGKRLSFSQGDARTSKIDGVFDAVFSLFHVVSYQATNEDLAAMFNNAAAHLKPGGVFIFDYWYGPAVLTERPSVRIKRMESNEAVVTRLAEPTLHLNESCVDVNYHVFIRDKATDDVHELRETHRMRYLFLPEIGLLANLSGLQVMKSEEWLTSKQPGASSWGVCSVLRK